VFGAVMLVGTIGDVVIGGAQRDAAAFANTSCDAGLGPFAGSDASNGAAAAGRLAADQQQTVSLIISVGKQRSLPALAWQVAIQAGMQESGLRDLPGGDRDSAGIFQMRPSQGWGSYAQVTDPTYAVNKFYDVLTGIPAWQQQRPGESAQAVERSAFPLAYNNWESMAAFLVQHVGLPVRQAQPGDLMFLAYDPNDPSTIHHVFMYLGNDQIVEAPYQGHPVHQTVIDWHDPQLVQQAVRPGV
jgi:cell wall-associated NlpC family hydrolase